MEISGIGSIPIRRVVLTGTCFTRQARGVKRTTLSLMVLTKHGRYNILVVLRRLCTIPVVLMGCRPGLPASRPRIIMKAETGPELCYGPLTPQTWPGPAGFFKKRIATAAVVLLITQ